MKKRNAHKFIPHHKAVPKKKNIIDKDVETLFKMTKFKKIESTVVAKCPAAHSTVAAALVVA